MNQMVRQSGRESSSKGFTLVEMAMVLVIVGLLIGVGAPLLRTLVTNIKFSQSRDIVQAAVDSVESWTAGNNTLPGWTGSSPGTYSTTFASVVKNPNDAFMQPLIYLFDANLSPGSPTKDTICGRKTTSISITPTSGPNIPNVAFVVLSEGSDYKVDSSLSSGSTLNGIATTAITGSGNVAGTNATIAADTANDIVQWVTIDELRTKVGCQGAELSILNNELPAGNVSATYSASIYPNGGVPYSGNNYGWCINGTVPAGLNICAGSTALTSNSCPTQVQATNLNLQCGTTCSSSSICTAVATNSYNFSVGVYDNGNNFVQKSFVVTFSP